MTWVKLDQHFLEDPKIEAASPAAVLFWIAAIAFCNRRETDGFVQRASLRRIAVDAKAIEPQAIIDELIALGLFHDGDDGYWINAYERYQRTRDERARERALNNRRQAISRQQGLADRIKLRDASACRYCSQSVSWVDRRGETGATYDLVDPAGGNTFENLVVACRSCNTAKGDRTPDEAGMPLLPPPNPPEPTNGVTSDRASDNLGSNPERNESHRNGSAKLPAQVSRAGARHGGYAPVDIETLRQMRGVV